LNNARRNGIQIENGTGTIINQTIHEHHTFADELDEFGQCPFVHW
jgi:hypothetical protein